MPWLEATLRWYGLLLVLTLCWAPWVRLLCRRLPDGGVSLGRPLALLGTIYPAWLAVSLGWLPLSSQLLWITLAAAGIVGWAAVAWNRQLNRAWVAALAIAELTSAAAFAGYIWLRGFTPEILHTEKPMEAAFLMSSAVTTSMPPPDPWFAGEPINYYYLGYLLFGSLGRLAEIPGTTAFNLALATTFSLAVTAGAGLGWNIIRQWYSRRLAAIAAVVAATLLTLAGNLYAALQVVRTPNETLAASWWDKLYGVGWRSSRIVCDTMRVDNDCAAPFETINEFPSFSFILGDLHPHVLALPFTIVALGLAFNALNRAGTRPHHIDRGDWIRYGVTGAVIGSLYAFNSWDFPTYLLIAALAVWWGASRSWRPVLVLVATAVISWLPFYLAFTPPTGGTLDELPEVVRMIPIVPRLLETVAIHTGEHTSAAEFLTIFGVPYAFGLWLVGSGWSRRRHTPIDPAAARLAVISTVMAVVAAIVLAAPLILLCGIPLAAGVALVRRDTIVSPRLVALALFAVGLTLILGTELVFIRDVFQNRMNTLFKFYYQVWVLFAVMAAVAMVVIWREHRPRGAGRTALLGLAAVSLAAGLVSPVLSAKQWTNDFARWSGLDGIAYLADLSVDELAAVRWLQANRRPDDVLLEAAGCSYQVNGGIPLSRAATFSGVPTVIGWSGHERQWRSGNAAQLAEIDRREAEVAEIFADPGGGLSDQYGITLLYVGTYEAGDWQHLCAAAGPYVGVTTTDFPGPGWEVAFTQGEVTIYRRQIRDDAAPVIP